MSVTEYLTDHNGNRVAFFYYIENERYLTAPQLVWQCRDHRQYKGRCASKSEFIECAKAVLKELKKRKTCDVCDKSLQGMENEGTRCIDHDFE